MDIKILFLSYDYALATPSVQAYHETVPMRHTPYAWVFEVLQFVTEQIKKVILCIAYGEEGFLFGNVVDYCILIGVFARW